MLTNLTKEDLQACATALRFYQANKTMTPIHRDLPGMLDRMPSSYEIQLLCERVEREIAS